MEIRRYVSFAAELMEVAGVLAMVLGTLVAAVLAVREVQARGAAEGFRVLRQSLGRGILLGLEFLVGADIIRTVSEVPSLQGVLVLAVIVVIRTFLSFTLQVELEGRWPWQPERRAE